MPIFPAHPSDHALLTQLTLDSKAHRGYGAPQIDAWREELTITAAQICSGRTASIFYPWSVFTHYEKPLLSSAK